MIRALAPYISLKWLMLDDEVSTDSFRQALGTYVSSFARIYEHISMLTAWHQLLCKKR